MGLLDCATKEIEGLGKCDRGKLGTVRHAPTIRICHQEAADRGKRLSVTQHFFPPFVVGKQFRQPRNRGDEFHAHTDENQATKEEQHPDAGGESRAKRRERIDENAPG
jgi:hypothetical protein